MSLKKILIRVLLSLAVIVAALHVALLIYFLILIFQKPDPLILFGPKNENEIEVEVIDDFNPDEESEHLKFKGVPIDGTLELFVGRMKYLGFQQLEYHDGTATMGGDFADFKECTVIVNTLMDKDLVSKVIVLFPERTKWEQLESDYLHLKELLSQKYGKPKSCTEKFVFKSYEDRDDSHKIYALEDDRCTYTSFFSTNKGNIVLSITHGNWHCYTSLAYYDRLNSEVIQEHALDDL